MNQRSNCEAGDTFFAQNPQVFSYVKLFGAVVTILYMLWLSGGFCWRGVSEQTSRRPCGEPKIMEMLDKPADFVLFQLYPVEG